MASDDTAASIVDYGRALEKFMSRLEEVEAGLTKCVERSEAGAIITDARRR